MESLAWNYNIQSIIMTGRKNNIEQGLAWV